MAAMRYLFAIIQQTVDALDVVLIFALTLLTIGVGILWGGGAACLTLGTLLLVLVMIGFPIRGR